MMETRKKIELTTSVMDTIVIMSEGNPGAIRVLVELIKYAGEKGLFLILGLDDMNIRGWQIWVGYKDYCNCNIELFADCIRNRDFDMVNKINEEAIRMKVETRAITSGASFKRG